MWLNIIGFIGAVLACYSSIPQLFQFYKQGNAVGISKLSQWLNLTAIVLKGTYQGYTTHMDCFIIIPYIFLFIISLITIWYIYYPREIK